METPSLIVASPWRPIARPLYPWVRTIEKILVSIQPLPISGPVVYVASDYSGLVKSHLYDVVSVVYLDVYASRRWEQQRRLVRQDYLGDGRRMSFKALNDRNRQQALVPFLAACNEIHGVAISLAVRKTISNLCTDDTFFRNCVSQFALSQRWKRFSFERMTRVCHLIALLMGGLSQPRQHIYWISDQDDMFANTQLSSDVANMLGHFSGHYVSHGLGELGMGTTAIDEQDRQDEDLNAICDLMSGAVADVTTGVAQQCHGRIPAPLAVRCAANFSPKAELIYSWISDQSHRLRRAVIVFDKDQFGRLTVFKFSMS